MPMAGRGFTLVEMLVVVILLAILAVIAIPQYWDVTTDARSSNLRENLAKIRAHIQVYRNQHARYPDGDAFAEQMTRYTSFTGETSDTRDEVHRFGPYLEQMPDNPLTASKAIRFADDPAEAFTPPEVDGGWWYNEATGEFRADLTDSRTDQEGVPFNRY